MKFSWHTLFIKLGSRKFWALIGSLAVSVMAFTAWDENVKAQVVALITSFGSVVVYMVANAASKGSESKVEKIEETNKDTPSSTLD